MAATATKKGKKPDKYEVSVLSSTKKIPAPKLPYLPAYPKKFKPVIGLIGCGGITSHHLVAYKKAGYNVAALCDRHPERVDERRKSFYPKAEVYTDYTKLLEREDINVVDITTHPPHRPAIIEAALNAGKHVLSQKPFVIDLDVGERLCNLADQKGLKLAVNQNGRWSPHFSYMRQAIQRGLIGKLFAAHLSIHWDHNWVQTTPLANVRHCILYDFAIHWFDILNCFMGDRVPSRVYASFARSPSQTATPAMLAQALVEYDDAQATLSFDADTKFGAQDRTFLVGSEGTLTSVGPNLSKQIVQLHTKKGIATPKLTGTWFPDGFHGTMGELLSAIEENREPYNSGRNNLRSLALCFAAIASAEAHAPVVPGTVRTLAVN